jgi:hypothetical protein
MHWAQQRIVWTQLKLAAACTGHKGGTGDDSPPAMAEERCKSDT